MKKGTIVRNMWQPNHESLLVIMGIRGKYVEVLWMLDGEFKGEHQFYKQTILNDRESFPIVGYVDYEKAIMDAIRKGLVKQEKQNDS